MARSAGQIRSAQRRAEDDALMAQLEAAGSDEDGQPRKQHARSMPRPPEPTPSPSPSQPRSSRLPPAGTRTTHSPLQSPRASSSRTARPYLASSSSTSTRIPAQSNPRPTIIPSSSSSAALHSTQPVERPSARKPLSQPRPSQIHHEPRNPLNRVSAVPSQPPSSSNEQKTQASPSTSKPSATKYPTIIDCTGDIEFLERYIRSTIWSYGYHGSLAFKSKLMDAVSFESHEAETLADANTGPHALSNAACNTEFLTHERWLLCMCHEVLAISPDGTVALEDRRSELHKTLRSELSRLEVHKEAEWMRQGDVITSYSNSGVSFCDTCE